MMDSGKLDILYRTVPSPSAFHGSWRRIYNWDFFSIKLLQILSGDRYLVDIRSRLLALPTVSLGHPHTSILNL